MNMTRFKVILGTGCWEWQGYINSDGYANYQGSVAKVFCELFHGKMPPKWTTDHLCRNRACVNPGHLEAVPHIINVRRGTTGIVNRSKTHCPSGHPYDEKNTRIINGRRVCKKCDVLAHKKCKANRKPLAVDDPRHGSVNGYQNWKCRCLECANAWRLFKGRPVKS